MAINPGIVGHSIIETIYDKISEVKKQIANKEIKIVIDGGVNLESSPRLIKAGAYILVCGSSTIFRPEEGPLQDLTRKYLNNVNSALENQTH